MDSEVEQGYWMDRILSNLNQLEIDRLDDADQDRIEKARALLEDVTMLTRLEGGESADVHVESCNHSLACSM